MGGTKIMIIIIINVVNGTVRLGGNRVKRDHSYWTQHHRGTGTGRQGGGEVTVTVGGFRGTA